MARIADVLSPGALVGIDTPAFIYHLDGKPLRQAVIGEFFLDLARGSVRGVTSAVTLLEVLVRPLQVGRTDAARDFESFLYEYSNLVVLEVGREVARRAAGLRASYRLATADSMQIATALAAGAEAFLTNDRRVQRVQEIPVLIVDDFLAAV